jgi:hypothetical protein
MEMKRFSFFEDKIKNKRFTITQREGERKKKDEALPQFLCIALQLCSAYRGLKAIGDEGQWGRPP